MATSAAPANEAGVVSYCYELLPRRRFAFVSDNVTDLTGYTPEEHYADADLPAKLVHGDDAAVFVALIGGDHEPDGPLLLRWITRDGRLIWTEAQFRFLRDDHGRVFAVEGRLRDVTRDKAIVGHDSALAEAIARSQEGVVVTDATGTITYVNRAFADQAGYRPAELIGRNPRLLQSGVHSAAFYRRMWRRLASGRSFSGGFVNRRRDGSLYREATIISPFRDENGQIAGYVGVKRNTTSEQAAIEALALERAQRDSVVNALASIDAHGDAAETAQLICRQLLTITDIAMATVVAFEDGRAMPLVLQTKDGAPWPMPKRLPANEATLLRAMSSNGPWVHAAESPASTIMAVPAVERGIEIFGGIGLRHGDSVQGALVVGALDGDPDAQSRLQLALGEFGPLASALLGEQLQRRAAMRAEKQAVRRIIRTSAFEPVFQPVVDLGRRSVLGYELLTRFLDGTSPQEQFAAAYAIGLEIDLELATLRLGIEAARGLPPGCWLAVNVSPELLLQPARLMRVLQHADRPLVLELTEHRAVSDYCHARAALDKLGPKMALSVDDAGAGYASLRHILELHPAYVKLDAQIVRGVSGDAARQALVAGFRYFANRVGCIPIAEGIEEEADLATLTELGITVGQGYLLGRPASVEQNLRSPAVMPTKNQVVLPAPAASAAGAPTAASSFYRMLVHAAGSRLTEKMTDSGVTSDAAI